MDSSVKENVKYKNIQVQGIQEIWVIMKRPSFLIIKNKGKSPSEKHRKYF